MMGSHLQSHVTHRSCGHVTNQKRYIFTFPRPMDPKLEMRRPHPQSHATLQYRGHVTNKKRNSTFTIRPMDPKLCSVAT